ncbi:MAG: hydrogenase expression/formation protein [Gammaproteobacteria bacterium]|jgi:hydrogenase-1 operon protein HyaF|nr:hydrogenase expression/formation protein [Gammaproteobacteria bacterium]
MNTSATAHFNIHYGDELTQNVSPLLHEVKHALDSLIETGKTSIIDLRSIPLAPGEEDKILQILGRGEVQAQLYALGQSEIFETQYTGVWIVTHYNDEKDIISRFIEVTTMPEILCSQTEDMMAAYSRLALYLADEQKINESPSEKSA